MLHRVCRVDFFHRPRRRSPPIIVLVRILFPLRNPVARGIKVDFRLLPPSRGDRPRDHALGGETQRLPVRECEVFADVKYTECIEGARARAREFLAEVYPCVSMRALLLETPFDRIRDAGDGLFSKGFPETESLGYALNRVKKEPS